MKKILFIILSLFFTSCNSIYLSEKLDHVYPTTKDRINNSYSFISRYTYDKIKPGMSLNQLKSLIDCELTNYKTNNNFIYFYSHEYLKNFTQISIKLSNNNHKIISKEYKKLKLENINKDITNLLLVPQKDDSPYYSYRSVKKYLIADGEEKWYEQAGFHINFKQNLISFGCKYTYTVYFILNAYKRNNIIFMHVQNTETCYPFQDVKLIKIRLLNKGKKIKITGFNDKSKNPKIKVYKYDGIFSAGKPIRKYIR